MLPLAVSGFFESRRDGGVTDGYRGPGQDWSDASAVNSSGNYYKGPQFGSHHRQYYLQPQEIQLCRLTSAGTRTRVVHLHRHITTLKSLGVPLPLSPHLCYHL